jgi:hypothetical protein
MTFLIFSQLLEKCFPSKENTFQETKPNFSLSGKCFLLINFSNDKQIQESLKSDFQKTIFRKINMALILQSVSKIL